MTMNSPATIEALVADLQPVRPVRSRNGIGLLLLAAALVSVAAAWRYGLRPDIVAGAPHPMVVLRLGTLLLLGLATGLAAIASVRPAVGKSRTGWQWALAGALLFPLAALIVVAWNGSPATGALAADYGEACLRVSLASALFVGGALTIWLRQGACVRPKLTGWLTGLAAGSFGTFAYALHCPMTDIVYIGVWYSAAVGLAALAGRAIVPPLLRW
jgi:hypothetical protein